jgi:hypothetical protein
VPAPSESSRLLFGNRADTWRAHVLGARQVLTLMKRNERTKEGFMDNNSVRDGEFLRIPTCVRIQISLTATGELRNSRTYTSLKARGTKFPPVFRLRAAIRRRRARPTRIYVRVVNPGRCAGKRCSSREIIRRRATAACLARDFLPRALRKSSSLASGLSMERNAGESRGTSGICRPAISCRATEADSARRTSRAFRRRNKISRWIPR